MGKFQVIDHPFRSAHVDSTQINNDPRQELWNESVP